MNATIPCPALTEPARTPMHVESLALYAAVIRGTHPALKSERWGWL